MAMNFWEAQRRARSKTWLYLLLFTLLTIAVAFILEWAMRALAEDSYQPSFPFLGTLYLAITFIVAGSQYLLYRTYGGSYVAESIGASKLTLPSNLQEEQLLNIVQEIAIASSLPAPPVYLMKTPEINAFAAGLTADNAAIAITTGALQKLNRDEVQGVIAHEFGHIYNGDMKISMRLAAMVVGFFCVFYLGMRLLNGTYYYRPDEDRRGGNPVALMALLLMLAGTFTWFMGSLLKCSVSREREYLADACAVQFTRNPDGIATALRKIDRYQSLNAMPKEGQAYSHMYFDDRDGMSSLFATHPPLKKRIEAIEARTYIPDEWLNNSDTSKQVT